MRILNKLGSLDATILYFTELVEPGVKKSDDLYYHIGMGPKMLKASATRCCRRIPGTRLPLVKVLETLTVLQAFSSGKYNIEVNLK